VTHLGSVDSPALRPRLAGIAITADHPRAPYFGRNYAIIAREGLALGQAMMPRMRYPSFLALHILCLVFTFVPTASPLRAEGKLSIIERFADSSTQLMVAHYTDAGAPAGKGRVGLLAIATPTRNAFAFNLAEWKSLIALCNRAAEIRSKDWIVVGTMTETGTSDVSHLTVSAGPGVNFVITSPKDGTVAHVVPMVEFSRFQNALREVQDYLSH
jgi:hypothetical protein